MDANRLILPMLLVYSGRKSDTALFAREDHVEEAWRIVDPVLRADTPVYEYEPGTRGPVEASRLIVPPGGWHAPVIGGNTKEALRAP